MAPLVIIMNDHRYTIQVGGEYVVEHLDSLYKSTGKMKLVDGHLVLIDAKSKPIIDESKVKEVKDFLLIPEPTWV